MDSPAPDDAAAHGSTSPQVQSTEGSVCIEGAESVNALQVVDSKAAVEAQASPGVTEISEPADGPPTQDTDGSVGETGATEDVGLPAAENDPETDPQTTSDEGASESAADAAITAPGDNTVEAVGPASSAITPKETGVAADDAFPTPSTEAAPSGVAADHAPESAAPAGATANVQSNAQPEEEEEEEEVPEVEEGVEEGPKKARTLKQRLKVWNRKAPAE